MSVISKMRKQKAIYWAYTGIDQFGQKQYDVPVEISCRWEDVAEEFLDANGVKQISSSIVYVDRDIILGSILKLGEINDDLEEDPKSNDNVYDIKRFNKLPNFKNTEILRTVYL